jgi:hypothetical protein
MKKVKYFFIDFAIGLLVSLPCFFLCDYLNKKGSIDWLDILIGIAGVSVLLLVAYIVIGRWNKKMKAAKLIGSMTIVAFVATIVYSAFMLLEWWFPDNADSTFTGNWVQWFPVSISLAIFLHLQERHRMQNYKSENDLVVAAECHDIAEAEKSSAMLEEKGIKAMTVEKGNPMYIDSCSDAPLQVQVMGKDLHSAKKVLKLEAV